jgi:large subunit ribosomal protein L4
VTATIDLRTPDGRTGGSVELPAEVFDVQANMPLMHQVVVAQLAAARAGTHSTKTRGEVAGGGHKPYRQKGTGRARQGSTRAPQFAGGGVVHGPTPRNYAQRTPKKMKAAALRGALSDRARNGRVHVVSAVVTGDAPSTKDARKVVEAIVTAASQRAESARRSRPARVLFVVGRDDRAGWLSLRNLPAVHLLTPDQLNTYDVLVSDQVVFTRDALEFFLGRAGHELKVDETAPAEEAAEPAAKPKAKPADKAEAEPEDETHPYGEGSHAALPDGEQPDGFPIKGSRGSKRYHVPGSSHYNRTVADVWFADEQAAESAGFELPPSQRKAKEEGK